MGIEHVLDEHHTYDNCGRVILKNTKLNWNLPEIHGVRNGPATSQPGWPGFKNHDIVSGFKYSSWPWQAEEFIRRQRRYGWPTRQLLQEAVQHGVFLVPVGHKLSQTEVLEWRLSASLAERCLMFSLSTVHIKCYVVLKMLIKTFVEPLVSKCISSYHCKTALLYCTENTDPKFWRDDNLLQCITQCLFILIVWVTNGSCPHFVISEENLFTGKVTARNRGVLMSILRDIVSSNGRVLLRVNIDDLGHKLLVKQNIEPSVMPVFDSLETKKLVWEFEQNKHACANSTALALMHNVTKTTPTINKVNQDIEMLKNIIKPSDRLEQQAITTWTQILSGWLGSLLASVALSHRMEIPQQALRLLCIGAKSDCAATLKLASVLYCSGYIRRAGTILKKLEKFFCRNETSVVCTCYIKHHNLSLTFCRMMYVLLRGKKTRAKLFAHCVSFSSLEIHCAPLAVRNELFRHVGHDKQHRHPVWDRWMALAVVDCLPFLYYLQFMTYRQLGQRELQTMALHNLDRCIREDNDIFRHLETAWNLLGQCMELEHQPDAAMACYRTSLQIRPRNNAANWHVATLCYKLIRNRKLTFSSA